MGSVDLVDPSMASRLARRVCSLSDDGEPCMFGVMFSIFGALNEQFEVLAELISGTAVRKAEPSPHPQALMIYHFYPAPGEEDSGRNG